MVFDRSSLQIFVGKCTRENSCGRFVSIDIHLNISFQYRLFVLGKEYRLYLQHDFHNLAEISELKISVLQAVETQDNAAR